MPATVKPLTDTGIRNAKPKAAVYMKADGRGLYLRVAPTGAKTWIFRYDRPDTGKQNYLSLGVYPELTLEAARVKREEARTLLAQSIDPQTHRETQRQTALQARAEAFTLGAVIGEWLSHKAHTDAPATRDKRESIVRNHILAGLGRRPIRAITRPEIVTHLTKVHAARPRLVSKVNEYLDDMWEFACNKGHAETNPTPKTRGLFANIPAEKNFAHITDPIRLGEVLRRMDTYNGAPEVQAALRLLPYLMLRPGELRALEWIDEVQLDHPDGPRLAINRSRMKARVGKAASRGPHIVPLPRQLVPILENLRPLTGHRRFVFTSSSKPKVCISEAAMNVALMRLGVPPSEQVPHGFRHIASTWLNEQAASHKESPWTKETVERQLDHGDDDATRSTYNKAAYLAQRRIMLQTLADYLDTLKLSTLS